MKQIDYELRGMKVPFLGDAPLASSYAEKSGYATMSDNTYANFCDDYSNVVGDTSEDMQSKINTLITNVNDLQGQLGVAEQSLTDAQNELSKANTAKQYRQGRIDYFQPLYDALNSKSKLKNDEKKQLDDYRKEIKWHRGFLETAYSDARSWANTVNTRKGRVDTLKASIADFTNQIADLTEALGKKKAMEELAKTGKTFESVKIESDAKRQAEVLRAEADAMSVKSSSRGKLLLIVGGVGLVGLIAMLVLRRN